MLETVWKLLTDIRGFITEHKTAKAEERAKHEKALESLSQAILTTRNYLARMRQGDSPNNATELELAEMWSATSFQLRAIDAPRARKLAKRCMIKAHCWSDRELWTNPEYEKMSLDIDSIFMELRKLIDEKTPASGAGDKKSIKARARPSQKQRLLTGKH